MFPWNPRLLKLKNSAEAKDRLDEPTSLSLKSRWTELETSRYREALKWIEDREPATWRQPQHDGAE